VLLFQEMKSHAVVFQKLSGDIQGINKKLDTLGADVDEQQDKSQVLVSLQGKIGKLEEELKKHHLRTSGSTDCCDKLSAEIGALNAKIDSFPEPKDAQILAGVKSQEEVTQHLKDRAKQLEAQIKAVEESKTQNYLN